MPEPETASTDFAAAVGARVRELRERRGMSLGALAKATGVGKGTLSELESGRRNPTLATLFAITTALEVPIGAALAAAKPAQGDAEPVRGDAIEAALVDRFDDASAVSELYRVTMFAGREQYSEPHSEGVTEHWIVYSGAVELGPLDATVSLGPGESTSFTADVPHRYRVLSDEDVLATLLFRYPR
ncbi:MAG TPA: XRE family transcriptional regulator [Solirubrobacterales bacterium]|jgi:transcriptional regulator with XRE-family HTH domain